MSTANPLEQLRRRMQSHATPAAFAALAEEHRRAGRLDEAIAVCRDGLERYPAYVSARVTLGRALLDSGDVGSAVAELEQAAAQSPDNLAAARALALAQAAVGAAPSSPPYSPPADLPMRVAADEDTAPIPPGVIATALTAGPDRPQEFGLDPDWSIPDAPTPAAGGQLASPGGATSEWAYDEGAATEALFPHAEAPTMFLAPQHLQGEEPAGIWPVPASSGPGDDAPAVDARACSWAFDPMGGDDAPGMPDPAGPPIDAPVSAAPASVWDALTIDAAVADLAPSSLVAEPPSVGEPAAANVELSPVAPSDGPSETTDEGSSFWTGVFGGESEVETPPPFSGWGDEPVTSAPDVGLSPWAAGGFGDESADCGMPDGPSAAWTFGGSQEASGADAVPFHGARDEVSEAPVAAPVAPSVPVADAPDLLPMGVAWAGSVRSALGEVYARAGHGHSLEPPSDPSPAVRTAMADAAVEAALEDAVLRDDASTPALLCLQQMLDSVRARRAALFHDLNS